MAGIAGEFHGVLVSGLVLPVAFMGLAATLIARLLARNHWVAYLGVAVILYVSLNMIWKGAIQIIETMI